MGEIIYWHTCGLVEKYPYDNKTKTGDTTNCPEMGTSKEGTPCIVFKEVNRHD